MWGPAKSLFLLDFLINILSIFRLLLFKLEAILYTLNKHKGEFFNNNLNQLYSIVESKAYCSMLDRLAVICIVVEVDAYSIVD